MKIQATFIGEDGSLGYEKNKTYELFLVYNEPNKFLQIISHGMLDGRDFDFYIYRKPGIGYCPYKSIETFFKNWTNIKTI